MINNKEIKKIVEVGFGDYSLAIKYNIPEGKKYIGFDVVESLMQKNTSFREFRLLKRIEDMKESGDLIIIKDVMQHWPNKEANYFMQTIVPRFKYALLTNDMTSGQQRDITFGSHRQMNFDSIK